MEEGWVQPSLAEINQMRMADELVRAHEAVEHDDRRDHIRLGLHANVTLRSETNFFMGLSENISSGGVFVATYSPPPEGETVQLKVSLDGKSSVYVEGVVRWMRTDETGNVTGCGIQFVDLNAKQERQIIELLGRLQRDPLLCDF